MSRRGAEFRKCDLQIHSPRDSGWDGPRPEAGLADGATLEELRAARKEFCRALFQKCKAEGVRAIAITDHHEGVYLSAALAAKAELEAEAEIDIWLFAGMELTFKDSCQGLLIFDSDLPLVLFEKARNKLGLPADCVEANVAGIQVNLLSINIADLQELLSEDAELRNRFILLPHVKPGGHKTVLRTGFHKRFKEMPYVGGYMDRCYPNDLDAGDRRILDGEIPDWSSDKRGVISTSDSRFADFRLIGQHASWLKLALPTAESIRQAMLAPDSRIRHDEPTLPSVVISSLRIEGADYVADETYLFNQQMNAVIGGRGAGKSSLLEYLRFGLGCSALDGTDASDVDSKPTTRMREMLTNTLSKERGRVVVEVLLNGAPVKINRTMANLQALTVESGDVTTSSTPADVVKLVPAQPFRQGELSDLARDELADRLLQLVTANAAERISEIGGDLRKNGQQLSEALAKAVRLTSARQRRDAFETESRLTRSQMDSLQEQVSSSGVVQTPAITDHEKYLDEERNIHEAKEALTRGKADIDRAFSSLHESMGSILNGRPKMPISALNVVYAALASSRDHLIEARATAALAAERALADLEVSTGTWTTILATHGIEYEAEKQALVGKQDLLVRLEELNVRMNRVAIQLEAAAQEEREFRTADEEVAKLRSRRAELHAEYVGIVSAQAQTIEHKSGGLAVGQLSPEIDFVEAEAAVHVVLDMPMLREKRIDSLMDAIKTAENPAREWEALLDELLALVKWKEGGSIHGVQPPLTPKLEAALDTAFLEKLRSTISSDRVASALRAALRPKVDLFQRRGAERIDFRKASQGEQAATLLNILMNQSKGPLIIDQPEEDLDNRIINDIIRTMRRTKDERQLILCTHNANIAVNGDSELVIEMSMGQKRATGAIDELGVRDAITTTMEGGRDAFELRRKKYNF